MKKIKHIAILACALAMVPMAFSSCDAVNGLVEKVPGLEGVIDGIIGDKHEHVFSDATCTEPKKCECGAVEGEPLGHTYVDGKCACGAEDENYVPPHVHNYNAVVTAPTCTVAGYTTYTCECGDTYTADEVAAPGHKYESEVTAPTCTVAGYTTYTCACGDSYTADEVAAPGHKYESEVTAPTCTVAGYTTYTCDCGDTYTEAGEAAKGHSFIDSVCHCGAEYVAPEATWTLITELKEGVQVLIGAPAYGKLLSAEKVSAGSYYNKGVDYTVENFGNVTDAEIFVVTVNADKTYTFTSLTGKVIALAASYSSLNDTGVHKSWSLVDKGDGLFLVKNVGRGAYLEWYSSKNNWSTYTAGDTNEYELSFYAKQVSEENHVHNYISKVTATCTEDGYKTYTCDCGDSYTGDKVDKLGHINENEDNLCDRCGWDMNLKVSNIVIATDTTLSNGVVTKGSDDKAVAWTWSDDNFDAIIAKGTSTFTLYTTAKAYMQLKKQNTFTLDNKNDVLIKTVTISVTSATYLGHLETVISGANLTYTKDETAFTITVEWNSTEDFVISNTATSTIYVSGVEIVYK